MISMRRYTRINAYNRKLTQTRILYFEYEHFINNNSHHMLQALQAFSR